MSLWRYVVGRLAQSAVLVLLVITLAFFLMRLAPGDPVLFLPTTLLLMIPSLILAAGLGILLGIEASRRLNSWRDYLIGAVSMMGYSTPPFWLGIIFIVVFASSL